VCVCVCVVGGVLPPVHHSCGVCFRGRDCCGLALLAD